MQITELDLLLHYVKVIIYVSKVFAITNHSRAFLYQFKEVTNDWK